MDKRVIKKGMAYLCDVDPDVAEAFDELGVPPPRPRPKGLEAFMAAIVSQQISKEAAASIWGRVKQTLPELSPEAVLNASFDDLRSAGLSRRKVEYTQGLAEAILDGRFNIAQLEHLPDDEAIEHIIQLRGFGRWSAEVYLMFSLGRKDVFPADDLALQVALGRLKGLEGKPKPRQARDLIEHWSPWRSVGSLFLWHYYRGAPQS